MDNNNQKKSHSFYREQEKSIFGQQQWTAKRIGKLFMKIMKWALYGFLIIATLWGCVNEFIIQTSNNLGQGVEFYQNDDFVYPNTYQATSITGYTATEDAVKEGIDSYTEDTAPEAIPFNFNVVNPNFMNDEAEAGVNTVDLYIKAADVTSSNGDVNVPMYTYNLNAVTAAVGANWLLTHDWTTHSTTDGFDAPLVSVPASIKAAAQEEVDAAELDDDHKYSVSSTLQFLFFLEDRADGTVDGKGGTITGFIEFDEEADVSDLKYSDISRTCVSLIPGTIITAEDALDYTNWSTVEKLDTSSKDNEVLVDAQVKMEVNKQAFLNGTGTESYSKLPDEVQGMFDEAGYDGTDYTADFRAAQPAGSTVYGGAQTFVVPIKKGFPVRISEESQNLIEGADKNGGFRDENFDEWNTSDTENDQGFDIENQMYGWTILQYEPEDIAKEDDYQLDLMRVYSNEDDAITGDVYSSSAESDFFYADQRRLGWGEVASDATTTNGVATGEDGAEYSVFDEKVKSWMIGEYYMHKESSTSVRTWDETANNGEGAFVQSDEVEFNYATKFAGMTSVQQISADSSEVEISRKETIPFVGTLPQVDAGNNYTERSILSDSVIPTGQDAWGESRITFIGLQDWGKAWDVQYGPLYGAFVFPLAHIAMFIGGIFSYATSAWGTLFSIIVLVFLTRGLGALLSIKGTSNQMKMQEVQTDVAKIKAKYSKYDFKQEPRMKQKQQSEIMALYRKKEINPMGSLGTIFITMPIFISLWIIISALPAYKVVFMGNFSWAVSAWYGIFNLGIGMLLLYLMVGISVGLVQGVSSKVPTWLSNKRKGIKTIDEATKAAAKKQNKTQNIMIGVFVFMGLTVPALFAFYWICSGFFTIVLELVKHAYKVHVADKKKENPQYRTIFEKMSKAK